MKKMFLSVLAIAFACTTVLANGNGHAKKAKAKHATCTNCPPGQKCPKPLCTAQGCCK